MKYISTRGKSGAISAADAIIKGIADDGGLYVPESIPVFTEREMDELCEMDYKETAVLVLGKFLDDFSANEIKACVEAAYSETNFDHSGIAPLAKLDGGVNALELWHGPTCAFKDMALQLMPHLFVTALGKKNIKDHALVLVATSGDTGKAALEGFRDVDGVSVAVFYPGDGVSEIQKRQMTTQRGGNVHVAGICGNFDDAQRAVKRIFADSDFNQNLRANGTFLTSANSINWGRLVPQIVYYVHSCARLAADGQLGKDERVDICVPTGNFGNILACYYAKHMGAPIGKLICASNQNNVLTDFIHSGRYDRNRAFHQTMSPSMDILVSSNLERLLFELSGHDSEYTADLMDSLASDGAYTVSDKIKAGLDSDFYGGFCDEASTQSEIKRVWDSQKYLLDTHTAVASYVLNIYLKERGENRPSIFVSTASPFKFAPDVLQAISGSAATDGFEALKQLSAYTGIKVPDPLAELENMPVIHDRTIDESYAAQFVIETQD